MFSKPHSFPAELEESIRQDVSEQQFGPGLNPVRFSTRTIAMLNLHIWKRRRVRFEYALLFRWEAGAVQRIHIDGAPPNLRRKASMNLVLKGGEGAIFEWYDAVVADEPLISDRGIPAWQVHEGTARLIHSEPLHQCSIVRTDVPHRVTNITTDTDLLCIRAQGNPVFIPD